MISAVPVSRDQLLEQLEDLRLDGHVERGGRLVGDQQPGPAGHRHRDQRALPHAAGELVRVLLEPAPRVGDADPVEQARRPRCAPPRRVMPRCRSSTSVTCSPIGTTGLSEDSGSWKIIADVPAAHVPHLRVGQRQQVASPSNRPVPATLTPRVGSRPMIASEVTDLPQPDSPTRPTDLAGSTSKRHPVDGGERPARPGGRTTTVRSRTSSSAMPAHFRQLRVEGLAHRLTEQGEAERGDDDRRPPGRRPAPGATSK